MVYIYVCIRDGTNGTNEVGTEMFGDRFSLTMENLQVSWGKTDHPNTVFTSRFELTKNEGIVVIGGYLLIWEQKQSDGRGVFTSQQLIQKKECLSDSPSNHRERTLRLLNKEINRIICANGDNSQLKFDGGTTCHDGTGG